MLSSLGYEREQNDAYYEPAWCDDRLFDFLNLPEGTRVWDPACGTGAIVEAAKRAGLKAVGTDIMQRWQDGTPGRARRDFLTCSALPGVEMIVSNPPFKHALEFAKRAIEMAQGVALLLPSTWMYGAKRSEWLATTPLRWILLLVPRPSMPPVGSDVAPGGGKVDYAWFVWDRNFKGEVTVTWLRK